MIFETLGTPLSDTSTSMYLQQGSRDGAALGCTDGAEKHRVRGSGASKQRHQPALALTFPVASGCWSAASQARAGRRCWRRW